MAVSSKITENISNIRITGARVNSRKPECDFIRGLPPAIAIEQKVSTRNPRSTVGTSTEIYDYMRMLFGRIGRTYSPVSGELVKKHSVDDVLAVAAAYPEGLRAAVVAPILIPEGRDLPTQLDVYSKAGYTRVVNSANEFIDISEHCRICSSTASSLPEKATNVHVWQNRSKQLFSKATTSVHCWCGQTAAR